MSGAVGGSSIAKTRVTGGAVVFGGVVDGAGELQPIIIRLHTTRRATKTRILFLYIDASYFQLEYSIDIYKYSLYCLFNSVSAQEALI
jgi:hypothetical protein